MSIDVGTIVTRYDSHEKVSECGDGVCVGQITQITPWPGEPDNPNVTVKWWQSCDWHDNPTTIAIDYTLDMLWEIGQIPQK